MYVLVFLCLETREAIVSSATEHPNSAWDCEQAELFLEETAGREVKRDIVMHDRDTKFTDEFVATLKQRGVRTNALPKASPNLSLVTRICGQILARVSRRADDTGRLLWLLACESRRVKSP